MGTEGGRSGRTLAPYRDERRRARHDAGRDAIEPANGIRAHEEFTRPRGKRRIASPDHEQLLASVDALAISSRKPVAKRAYTTSILARLGASQGL